MKNPTGIKLCISHKIATSRGPPLQSYSPNKSNYKNDLQQISSNDPSGFRGRKAILNHASALVSACP